MQEKLGVLHASQKRQELERSPYMILLEDHVRFDILEDLDHDRPARDHKITHAGVAVP
jgi:hypothetical protein